MEVMNTIAILEDNINLRQTIVDYFYHSGNYKVVFEGDSFKQFFHAYKAIEPDFLLLDIHLSDITVIDEIVKIKNKFISTSIIIITGDMNTELLIKAFENGVSGYILKPFSFQKLENVIEQICITGSFLEPELLTKLIGLMHEKKHNKEFKFDFDLSFREGELLELIKRGYTYREMAEKLNISYHTVNHHLKNIYLKANVTSKAELVAKYFQY